MRRKGPFLDVEVGRPDLKPKWVIYEDSQTYSARVGDTQVKLAHKLQVCYRRRTEETLWGVSLLLF